MLIISFHLISLLFLLPACSSAAFKSSHPSAQRRHCFQMITQTKFSFIPLTTLVWAPIGLSVLLEQINHPTRSYDSFLSRFSLTLSLALSPLSFFFSCQSSFVSCHRASPHCRSFWHEKSVTSDAVAPAPVLSAPLSSSGSFWQSNSGKLRLLRMVEERCEHRYWGKVKMVSVAEMRDRDQKIGISFKTHFFGWWDFLFVLRM